ncbi:HAMP domain-containing histidine kinase [Acidaminobacter sp. JC074]|uniref:sensor histidine kinase n=1 Tax=Acidaminobacter sp. JC074 TaxID=2530199 RepID=UPI001F10C1A5|nr:HAMP domain-containing sensor histidine kinase [Acidaminobacter sp. JC074]MCH4887976.1 HAMP domain-containing histidine kinase [Acidaminobacter sp. JC074]
MKLNRISRHLLKGYVLVLGLILVLILSVYGMYMGYTNTQLERSSVDMDQLILDYEKEGEKAFDKHALRVDDYLIITDKSYKIINAYNIDPNSYKSFFDLQMSDELNQNNAYYLFENYDGDLVFHLYLSPYEEEANMLFIFLVLAILIFSVFSVFYARNTSKKIIEPVNELILGAKNIGKGDYSYQVEYETGNELDLIRDEINQMSHQLKEEKQRRMALENERNQLIMNLSHDIKTPLTNVIGYSQALMSQSLDDNTKKSVETIYKYGLNAAALTEELFDYSKINTHELNKELHDIVELTRIKLAEYIHEFETFNINYEFDLPDTKVMVQLNKLMYQRVLDNLIQNAIKYNEKDFSLKIRLKDDKEDVEIIIEDDGIGIPVGYHESIFNPLVRVESSRNRQLGGTGLGLSIVKQILLQHKGDVQLDSSYTEGCRFILRLKKEN